MTIDLNRRICPGCGTEDPEIAHFHGSKSSWSECRGCGRSCPNGEMETIADMMAGRCPGFPNLGAFLRTLLKDEVKP